MEEIIYTHWQNRDINDMPNEIWRNVTGYNNKYFVSNLGRVKSIKMVDGLGCNQSPKQPFEMIIKQSKCKLGYNRCSLDINGKIKNKMPHVLVATAFIDNPFNKKEVHHKKAIRHANNSENLEWNTRQENIDAIPLNKDIKYNVIDVVHEDNSKRPPLVDNGYSFIYGITDGNGIVVYIGKSNSPIQRFRQHKTWARCNSYKKFNMTWLHDILKSGAIPELIILKKVAQDEWCYWESFFIKKYKDMGFVLLNVSTGGHTQTDLAKETFRMANIKREIPVTQFSKSGEFIQEWSSIALAVKTLGIRKQNVIRALKGGRPSGGGYKWTYYPKLLKSG